MAGKVIPSFWYCNSTCDDSPIRRIQAHSAACQEGGVLWASPFLVLIISRLQCKTYSSAPRERYTVHGALLIDSIISYSCYFLLLVVYAYACRCMGGWVVVVGVMVVRWSWWCLGCVWGTRVAAILVMVVHARNEAGVSDGLRSPCKALAPCGPSTIPVLQWMVHGMGSHCTSHHRIRQHTGWSGVNCTAMYGLVW